MPAHAQDSWKIKLNNKIILSTNKEDEPGNVRKITPADWTKKGNLEISYKEAVPETIFFDEHDNQLLTKEKTFSAKITVESPRNLNLAVRIRRVHLCTLELP
ncbi:MAG: hypothetical protein ACHQEB_03605 [Chitinophagales bacterium]